MDKPKATAGDSPADLPSADDRTYGQLLARTKHRQGAAHALYAATRADESISAAVRSTVSADFDPTAVYNAGEAWREAAERLDEAARIAGRTSEAANALHRLLTAPQSAASGAKNAKRRKRAQHHDVEQPK